jgi:hypothetical protein
LIAGRVQRPGDATRDGIDGIHDPGWLHPDRHVSAPFRFRHSSSAAAGLCDDEVLPMTARTFRPKSRRWYLTVLGLWGFVVASVLSIVILNGGTFALLVIPIITGYLVLILGLMEWLTRRVDPPHTNRHGPALG